MIDNFSLALTHGLMLIVAVRLLLNREVDKEARPKPEEKPKGWRKGRPRNA
jgi:hypothetical protein